MGAVVTRLIAGGLALLVSTVSLAATDGLQLVEAVRRQDTAAVHALLKHQVDVNAPQPDGATALHWAVHRNDLNTMELLIRAGAHVNAANALGVTPLYLACENRNAVMVEKLLLAGADPNATLPSGETALMTAARTGSVGAVKVLLAHGAKANEKEKTYEQTALMWATAEQHPDVVQALIEAVADVRARSRIRRVLVIRESRTISSQNDDAVSWIEEGGYSLLLFAARGGDIESARLLLAAGADVNDTTPIGSSALVVAAQSGHGALAAFLLDKGANPNADGMGYPALHAAVLTGDLNLVKVLLAHGANPNARLTNGSPVGRFSRELAFDAKLAGATPFFLAAKFVEVDIMRLLVTAGANPLLGLNDGTTPLMVAAGMRSVGLSGNPGDRRDRAMDPAEVDLAQSQNEDQRATMGSGIDAVKLTVELGGDVNAANQAGDTALHAAALHGFKTIIQFLIDKDAKPNVKNTRGQTPLMTASRNRDKSAAELLRKLGATE